MLNRVFHNMSRKSMAFMIALTMLFTVALTPTLAFIVSKTGSLINTFVSGLAPEGGLIIRKVVEHPFGEDYIVPGDITFTFRVDLGQSYAGKSIVTSQGNMTADEDGVIYLTVKAGGSAGVQEIAAGTKVSITEIQKDNDGFTVLDEIDTKTVSISARDDVVAAFVNTYAPGPVNPVNLEVIGIKNLEGRQWQEGDSFTFQLDYRFAEDQGEWEDLGTQSVTYEMIETEDPEDPEQTILIEKPDYNKFDFSQIVQGLTYSKPGIYSFRISEIEGTIGGITYDDDVSYFDVLVGDADMDGKLEIQNVIGSAGSEVVFNEESGNFCVTVTFNNTYAPDGSAEAIIRIIKKLEDRSGQNKYPSGFVFELYDLDGNLVMTSNPTTAAGETSLKLVFSADQVGQTFTYLLKELHCGETIDGLIYDDTEHEIYISILDNFDGTIRAVIYDELEVAPTPDETVPPETDPIINETDPTTNIPDSTPIATDPTEETTEATTEITTDATTEVTVDSSEETEATTEATEPATEATEPSTEGTQPPTDSTESTTESTQATTEATEAATEMTTAPTEVVTEPVIVETSQETQPTESTTEATVAETESSVSTTLVRKISVMSVIQRSSTKISSDKSNNDPESESTDTNDGVDPVNQAEETSSQNEVSAVTGSDETVEPSESAETSESVETTGTVESSEAATEAKDNDKADSQESFLIPEGATNVFEVTFENVYEPDQAAVKIDGTKKLTGRKLAAGEFVFALYRTGSDFVIKDDAKPLQNVTNDAEGKFAFGTQYFNKIGNYYFVVLEDSSDELGGVIYDSTKYLITVIVTDHNGTLKARWSVTDAYGTKSDIVFKNEYKPSAITLPFTGKKVLENMELTSGMFRFSLYEADKNFAAISDAIDTVSNDAEGAFTFKKLDFLQAGVYRYVVREDLSKRIPDITYDHSVYGITVTVTDNGKGQLIPDIEIQQLGGNTVEEIVFTNMYVEPETTAPTETQTQPTEPTETTVPTVPPTKPPKPGSPPTGDGDYPGFYVLAAMLSCFVLIILWDLRRYYLRDKC